MVTLTWHLCKYQVHKLHQRSIFQTRPSSSMLKICYQYHRLTVLKRVTVTVDPYTPCSWHYGWQVAQVTGTVPDWQHCFRHVQTFGLLKMNQSAQKQAQLGIYFCLWCPCLCAPGFTMCMCRARCHSGTLSSSYFQYIFPHKGFISLERLHRIDVVDWDQM